MNDKPERRRTELVVQESGDEMLVYDLRTHRAACLNPTSARVWELCDGGRTVAEISRELARDGGTEVDDALVLLAIDQLREHDLMERVSADLALDGVVSRRELVRRIGSTSMVLLPAVLSVIAPPAAAAASCRPSGHQFGCCQSDLTVCNNYCDTLAREVTVNCCSGSAHAVYGTDESCNTICVCD